MKVIEVTQKTFNSEVLSSDKVVVIDFNATWCGPCRMLAPILEELSTLHDDVKFVSINVDAEQELAARFNIGSIPCIVVIKDGKEVKRSVGFKPKAALEDLIKSI